MKSLLKSRIWLVVLGVGLGLGARMIFGGPNSSDLLPRKFSSPHLNHEADSDGDSDVIDLPIEEVSSETGLVPAIRVPSIEASSGMLDRQKMVASVERMFDSFAHDGSAFFEAHGEEVCASGCAASRHPTETLTEEHFEFLMKEFSKQPKSQNSEALEQLLYFGPQTKKMIEQFGFQPLDSSRATFLWSELQTTHAKISIRVIDQTGKIRTWLEPTLVPFDRRHVFKMETNDLQPLVTSGTVKRVGLNHMWVRL